MVACEYFHRAGVVRFVEATGPPYGEKDILPGQRAGDKFIVRGKRAGKMSGNKMLKTVWHAVPVPWAEAESVGKSQSRPPAESEITSPLLHEAAYRLRTGRAQSIGLASRGTSGHYEHLARQTGLGYV